MFADQQVMAFIRPMLANMDRYREIRAGALKAADNDLLGTAYDRRLQSPLEATKALMINSRDLAITLGDQLAPSFVSLVQELLPLIQKTKTGSHFILSWSAVQYRLWVRCWPSKPQPLP